MHYGVPGMKWGVRKARSIFTGRRQQQPQLKTDPSNKDRSKHWNKQQKRVGDMSTAELRRNLNRLKLENEFARQVKEATPPKSQSKAKQFVLGYGKEIITSDPVKNAIKDAIKGYVTGGAAGAVKGAKESAKQSAKSEAKTNAKDKIKETMANRNKNKKKKSKPDVIIVPDNEITRKGREVAIRQSEVNTVATYSSTEHIESYLEHFGTKGMRWGVRKVRRTDSDFTKKLREKTNANPEDKGQYKDFRKSRRVDKKVGKREKNLQKLKDSQEVGEEEARYNLGSQSQSHDATMSLVSAYTQLHNSNKEQAKELEYQLEKIMNKQMKVRSKIEKRQAKREAS